MTGGPPFELRVENIDGLEALVRALRAEEDGKQLRRDLGKNMRAALRPAAAEAKSGIMSMSSAGLGTSPALRSSIAKRIRPEVKLGGRWTGARVKARKTPNVRGFSQAPRRTQRPAGWRTQTFGNGEWRTQHGRLRWFDEAMQANAGEYRDAVLQAMEDMARRIANRAG